MSVTNDYDATCVQQSHSKLPRHRMVPILVSNKQGLPDKLWAHRANQVWFSSQNIVCLLTITGSVYTCHVDVMT